MTFIAHFDHTGLGNAAPAFQPIDFVLLEKKFNTLGVALNRFGFIRLHLRPIYRWRFGIQAHFCKIMFGFMKHM